MTDTAELLRNYARMGAVSRAIARGDRDEALTRLCLEGDMTAEQAERFLDLTWAPFYGKISILGEGIMHFDTYITAGGGVFGTDGAGEGGPAAGDRCGDPAARGELRPHARESDAAEHAAPARIRDLRPFAPPLRRRPRAHEASEVRLAILALVLAAVALVIELVQ